MNNFYRYPYSRSANVPPVPPPPNLPPVCPPPNPSPPKHPHKPCCNKKNPPKKKFNFKSFKKDTCTSLNDVEHFLCDFSTFVRCIKLYNLLKK